jgi:hypothetical protein
MADLELELRALGAELAVPRGDELPGLVRARIAVAPAPTADSETGAGFDSLWRRLIPGGGPARRAVLVAIALVLVLAAVAGAAALGLPGLRIVFGPAATPTIGGTPSASASPSGSAGPGGSPGSTDPMLGTGLGLGEPVDLEALADTVPFPARLPTDRRLGEPAVAWWEPTLGDGQLTILWRSRPGLPETTVTGVGALVTETPGTTDDGLIEKSVTPGGTAEPVTVDGQPGYWLTGPPHGFVWWRAADGEFVEDARRRVGDTLVWTDGGMLYRLETELGRDTAIEIAESMD